MNGFVVVCMGWNGNTLKALSASKNTCDTCQDIRKWLDFVIKRWTRVYNTLPQVENTIRWRAKRDEEGNETRESNARIVKWSDGRCVLCLAGFWGYYTLTHGTCYVLFMLSNVFFLLQHVPPPGKRGVWCLQSSSAGRPQPLVHPTGHWTAGTGCIQNQTHIQVIQ